MKKQNRIRERKKATNTENNFKHKFPLKVHLIYNMKSDYDNPVYVHISFQWFFFYGAFKFCLLLFLFPSPPHTHTFLFGRFPRTKCEYTHNIINILTKQKQNQQETRGKASGIYGNGKRLHYSYAKHTNICMHAGTQNV